MGGNIGAAGDFGVLGRRALSPSVLKNKAIHGTAVGSAFELGPKAGGFDSDDADATFLNVHAWGRAMRLTPEQLAPQLDKIFRAAPGAERYQAFVGKGGLMDHARDYLIERGVDPEHAAHLTTMFRGGLDDSGRVYVETNYVNGAAGRHRGRAISTSSWPTRSAASGARPRRVRPVRQRARSTSIEEERIARISDILAAGTPSGVTPR
jgi:hypothetical protein